MYKYAIVNHTGVIIGSRCVHPGQVKKYEQMGWKLGCIYIAQRSDKILNKRIPKNRLVKITPENAIVSKKIGIR